MWVKVGCAGVWQLLSWDGDTRDVGEQTLLMARMGKGREGRAASRARIQQGSVRLPRVAYGLSQSASEWHTQTPGRPAGAPRKATARVDLAGPFVPRAQRARPRPHPPLYESRCPAPPPPAPATTRRRRAQQLMGAGSGRFRLAQPLSAPPPRLARGQRIPGLQLVHRSIDAVQSLETCASRPLLARPTPSCGSPAHERCLCQ